MSHSRLYQLLEPMPDAASALARGRDLLRTHGSREPDDPCADLKPVTTAEQLAHSLAYFTKARLLGYPAPEDAAALRAGLVRLDIPHQEEDGDEGLLIDVELRPQVLELWPLPSPLTLLLWPADPFWFEESTEAELDAKVAALGPLAMDISWDCPLRGLPDPKLCGVQVCLNSAWREQCSDSEPGSFGVYLSIGSRARNRAVEDDWIRDSGLRLGEPHAGW